MKRALILFAALLVATTASLVSTGLVVSSSHQFARRVSQTWPGRVELSAPRVVDLNTAGFATIQVDRIAGSFGGRSLNASLRLAEVEWCHASWRDLVGPFVVGRSQLRFADGQLDVWCGPPSADPAAATPASSELASWIADALPERVNGRSLRCNIHEHDQQEPWLELRVEDASLEQRSVEGLQIRAALASEVWRQGLLEVGTPNAAEGLRIHLDDVDLAQFSLRAIAERLDLPWYSDFPVPSEGRADIDLIWHRGDVSVTARHYQTKLALPGLNRPLERLSGTITANRDDVVWTMTEGWYSHSKLVGSLRVNLNSRRVSGEFRLLDVVGDPELSEQATTLWPPILSLSRIAGRCDVVIPVDGYGEGDLFPYVEIVFEGLRARDGLVNESADRTSGLSGRMRFTPRHGQWAMEGSTVPSVVRGFHLPASRWEGSLDTRTVRLVRGDLTGPQVQLSIGCTPAGTPECSLKIDRLDLGDWLGRRGLTRAEASLQLVGEWHDSRGLSYTGWLRWFGLVVPDDTQWPMRRPHTGVDGEAFFNRHRGQDYLPAVAVRDGLTLWVGNGWIDREGNWELEGVAAHGSFPLPLASDAADLIRRPRENWERFRVRGPLFDWTAETIGEPSPSK